MNLIFLVAAAAEEKLAAVMAWDVLALRVDALSEARYTLGATVRIRARFGDPETLLDPSGEATPVDPGAVTIETLDPLGVTREIVSPFLIKEGTGEYSALLTADTPGRWLYRVTGRIDPWIGATEGSFVVNASAFAP